MKLNFTIVLVVTWGLVGSPAGAQPHFPRHFHDPGVDVGLIVKDTALLSNPTVDSDQIDTLAPGDWTVLASRDQTNGFLKVIKLSTGRQGWVTQDDVDVRYTHKPNKPIDLTTATTAVDNPPVIDVVNQSDNDIFLHVAGQGEERIPAHRQAEFHLSPGVLSFNASAPGTIPLFGSTTFLSGNRYTWKFWVGKAGEKHPPDVDVTVWSEATSLQAQIDAQRSDLTLTKHLLDEEEASVTALENKIRADKAYLDLKRHFVDIHVQSSIDQYNRLVDTLDAERHDYRDSIDRYNDDVGAYNDQLIALKAKEKRLTDITDTVNGQ